MINLMFVVNPDNHRHKSKYVSQDNISEAFKQAKRLSEKHENTEFYILEAKPIGKLMNGEMVHLSNEED